MIRNSVKYVSYKDLKEVTADLKKIYTANTEEMAHFDEFDHWLVNDEFDATLKMLKSMIMGRT